MGDTTNQETAKIPKLLRVILSLNPESPDNPPLSTRKIIVQMLKECGAVKNKTVEVESPNHKGIVLWLIRVRQ